MKKFANKILISHKNRIKIFLNFHGDVINRNWKSQIYKKEKKSLIIKKKNKTIKQMTLITKNF